jgi:flagellin-like protein
MNLQKNIRKVRKDVRAISPVIATLLMIAIAVVASLVVYAWVMGYMNFQTQKTGNAIQIQSISYNPTAKTFTIYVQNVGDGDLQFPTSNYVYINGAAVTPSTGLTSLTKTSTGNVIVPSSSLSAGVQSVTFKVLTSDGTFSQLTQQFTI